ncbi:tetratricopeptide repeat protein [candidate division KSB1 bacterium]|nr:tetratricopeptide repeat protein [candidate division KSB1 bacterium]
MPLLCSRKTFSPVRVFLCFLFMLFHLLRPCRAQDELDSFSPGAKAIGIGYSAVVGLYDASALYWNPASLAVMRCPQGLLSIHEPFTANYLAYSHFVPKFGSFAASIASTWENDPIQFATAGWGYQLIPGLFVGLNMNGLQQSEHSWMTFGVGMLFRPTNSILQQRSPYIADRLAVGFSLHNIPLGQQHGNHQIRLGLSYQFTATGPTLHYARHFMSGDDSNHLGLLFNPTPHVRVFAGIKDFDSSKYSFGGGFERDNLSLDLTFDALTKRLALTTSARIGAHPKQIADRYYNDAMEALKRRDIKAALQRCEYVLIYDENHTKANNLEKLLLPVLAKENVKIDSLLVEGQTFQNQSNYLAAAAQYLLVLKIDPKNREAQQAIAMIRPKVNIDVERWYQQAVQAYNDADIQRAKELFEAIILVRPDHFGSKNYLVKIQSYHSKIAEQHYFAGLGYYSQRKLDLAETEFDKALAIDPNLEDAANYLRRIKNERKEISLEISDMLDQAQRLDANKSWNDALRMYQEILKIQPDHSFALQRQKELLATITSSAERYYDRGKTAYDNKDYRTALELFNAALAIDPSHSGARRYKNLIADSRTGQSRKYLELAREHFENREWREAITWADSALNMNPSHAEATTIKRNALTKLDIESLMRQARAEYIAGRYLEALELFDSVLIKDADHAEAQQLRQRCQIELNARVDEFFNLGIQLYTEEKYQQAINMWNNVLRINPYHKGALDYKSKAQENLDVLKNMP